jgi:hypothetical protein
MTNSGSSHAIVEEQEDAKVGIVRREPCPFRHVLAAVDLSSHGRETVLAADALAGASSALQTLLHVDPGFAAAAVGRRITTETALQLLARNAKASTRERRR